jgi:hypothetical protein
MQSPLYFHVKNLTDILETSIEKSLDLLHCRLLITFYELGHGLDHAAYASIAVCARAARLLGIDKKPWHRPQAKTEDDMLSLEEKKRIWWSIVIMDRFIGLTSRDPMFVTDDAAVTDHLPIDDLLWAECETPADLATHLTEPAVLSTSIRVTVGQMAREAQVAHLLGRVIQHVLNPTADIQFNTDATRQLEQTLKAYLPLLSDEELKIGKYCGAFSMCNR